MDNKTAHTILDSLESYFDRVLASHTARNLEAYRNEARADLKIAREGISEDVAAKIREIGGE